MSIKHRHDGSQLKRQVGLATATANAAPTQYVGASTRSVLARTCSAGYVHANLSWGEKCLRTGQYCKVGNREYLRYGFRCPSTGHLVRRTATTSAPQPSHPAGATAKCNDGTFSYSLHHSGTCSHHGGVAKWL